MAGSYLLDTNIVIAFFSGEPEVVKRLGDAGNVFLPAIVLGELYYGAEKSAKRSFNINLVDAFCQKVRQLDVNGETATHYGAIKEAVRAAGKPIPENDIWIAAIARQHDLILVTRDRHFNEVPDLATERW